MGTIVESVIWASVVLTLFGFLALKSKKLRKRMWDLHKLADLNLELMDRNLIRYAEKTKKHINGIVLTRQTQID